MIAYVSTNNEGIDAYLASPYSHPDASVRVRRFELVSRAACVLMQRGHILYCPIAQTHPMQEYGGIGITNWEYWEKFDTAFVSVCRELWVLKLDGWMKSRGVQAEIKIATELRKPVRYIHPFDLGVDLS